MRGRPGPRRVLLAVDKFKGSLTAAEVARELAQGFTERGWEAVELPMADGGDGSVEAAVRAGYDPVAVELDGERSATIAWNGETAVVEVANTCGLAISNPATSALDATSVRFGEAVRAALDLRPRRLVLALGGSASTDGGMGFLASLGVRFLTAAGAMIPPSGRNLHAIDRIDTTDLPSMEGIRILVASDVTIPLLGPDGAAHGFARQKGASPREVDVLEAGMRNLASVAGIARWPTPILPTTPGAGAAGGLGFACGLLGGGFVSGGAFFLDLFHFDEHLERSDLVVVGEGRMDRQTLEGKLPAVVARRARGCPTVAVVGRSDVTSAELHQMGIGGVIELRALTNAPTHTDPELSRWLLRRVAVELESRMPVLICGSLGWP